jgi:hypothetical protein
MRGIAGAVDGARMGRVRSETMPVFYIVEILGKIAER